MTQLTLPGCAVMQLPLIRTVFERGATDFAKYVSLDECPYQDPCHVRAWWDGWEKGCADWLDGRHSAAVMVDPDVCNKSRYRQLLASGFRPLAED